MLEKLIFDKTIDFLTDNVISSSQFGFMKKKSTLQQLLMFMSYIFQSFDDKVQVDTIYLDIKKAFDTVSHSKLLENLWAAGLVGNAWKFFEAYLSDRQQFISINSHRSDVLPVISGVPHGSILGPMLFMVYINSLPEVLQSATCLLYADDTKCYQRISSHFDGVLLQNNLNNLSS